MSFGTRYATYFTSLSWLVLVGISFPTALWAAAGTSGGNILNIGVGARPIAMGEAYAAQADDVSSLYWNPAGLALLNQSQASFIYNSLTKDQNYNNASAAFSLESGGIGGSLSYLSFGNIAGYDRNGNATGDVSAYSGVGTLGGGLLMGPFSAGVNVKAVQAKLADISATGVAADVGGIWTCQQEIQGGTFRLGATVRNMGSGLKFIDQRDPFPMEWRLGAALVEMLDKKLNASLDYGKQRDVKGAIYSGLEYRVLPMIALRVGYAGSDTEGNGLRAGIGLRIRDFSFDYAYAGFGDLGITHRYELSMRFGAIRPRLTPEERAMYRKAQLAMDQGRYDQAMLLFDSLITMEPDYRPFQRWSKQAIKGIDFQEKEMAGNLSAPLSNKVAGDPAIEVHELADLLNLGEQAEATADARAAQVLPEAERSALSPVLPASLSSEPPVEDAPPAQESQERQPEKQP